MSAYKISLVGDWLGWRTGTAAAGPWVSETQVADLDGDGLLDLLGCDDTLYWTLNPGVPWIAEGEWASTWESVDHADTCHDLAVLDFDEDGDLDALIYQDTGKLTWYENDAGAFSLGGTLATKLHFYLELAVGDFDGDGRDDVAASPYVLWNDGGTATTGAMPCTPTGYRLSAAPILADGRSVLLCEAGEAYVAAADRTWSPVAADVACTSFGIDQGPVRTTDFDGDGHLDMLLLGAQVCLGDGTGALVADTTLFTPSGAGSAWVTTLADADADGWDDLVVNDQDAEDLHLYAGDTLTETQALWLPQFIHQGGGALWQDLDGDGAADLLAWDAYTSDWFWMQADGAGGFYTPWAADSGASDLNATAADLDGDGLPEIVSLDTSSAKIYWNLGDRAFSAADEVALPSSTVTPDPWPGGVDLDGDGNEEIVLESTATVLAWDASTGTFVATAETMLSTDFFPSVWWPDLDGDGDPEMIVENAGIFVDSSGTFSPEGIVVGGLAEPGFPATWTDLIDTLGDGVALGLNASADLDGDGLVDVVIVDATGARVWSWDGAALSESVSTDIDWGAADPTDRHGVGSRDADADGDVDLWIAVRGAGVVQILENDGAGGFSLGDSVAAPEAMVDAEGLVFRDLSDDVFGGWSEGRGGEIASWRWTDTEFEALPTATTGMDDIVTARDLDGDGAADLLGAARGRVLAYWAAADTTTVPCE